MMVVTRMRGKVPSCVGIGMYKRSLRAIGVRRSALLLRKGNIPEVSLVSLASG